MALIQMFVGAKVLNTESKCGVVLDNSDHKDFQYPKTLAFTGLSGEDVYVHLSPVDVKMLRAWALQQSINEL